MSSLLKTHMPNKRPFKYHTEPDRGSDAQTKRLSIKSKAFPLDGANERILCPRTTITSLYFTGSQQKTYLSIKVIKSGFGNMCAPDYFKQLVQGKKCKF